MTAVFLDLDGTLVDSRPGIVSSLRHAFQVTGQEARMPADLTWMIGPPFVESFARLGIADPQPMLDAYRARYQAEGMYDAQVYPGVIGALEDMAEAGHHLYLMTAKPHAYARKITAHFGLARYMAGEFGPELDGTRNWKGDLLAHALGETGETAARSVMVGDRSHDMGAAAEVGMASIAVRYGYGAPDDWRGAVAFINQAAEMPEAVTRVLG